MKKGETFEEAIRREAHEELGYELDCLKALFMHGTQNNISELVYPDNAQRMENILENMNEDVFANGHTHI